jgi:hypothetical protein
MPPTSLGGHVDLGGVVHVKGSRPLCLGHTTHSVLAAYHPGSPGVTGQTARKWQGRA